jgi:hypothetical protein
MPRKAIQLLILPFLFALLAAGGNTTLCDAVSLFGLETHHHASTSCEDEHHSNPLCLHGHDEGDDHSGSEKIPCSEACEIKLSEAPSPTLHKVPQLPVAFLSPLLVECHAWETVFSTEIPASKRLEPPGNHASLITPLFTGCFLI